MKQIRVSPLRQEREKRGWSRNYVAEQLEVDVITVGRWERGERMPHPQYRQKLCVLFEMKAQELGLYSETPQEPDDGSSVAGSSLENVDSVMLLADSSQELESHDSMAVVVSPQQELSTTNKAVTKPTPLLMRHRRELLVGLGGLVVVALTGSSLLSTVHSPLPPGPVLMPASKRLQHLLDANLSNWINHITWSPDGRNIAAANGSNVVSIWDVENGALVRYYPTLNQWVNDVAWSQAGWIAAATADFHGGSLQIWSFPADKPAVTFRRPYALRSGSWSPDGKYLAFAGHAITVEVWDPFASRQVSQYSYPALGSLGITRVKWSASGTLLACVADDGTAHVWEAFTGNLKTLYREHQSTVLDLAWSPDDRFIATASIDKTTRVWDVSNGRTILTYRGHAGEVEGVDWSPRGNYIASGGKDRTVQVWNALTGKQVARYEGHSSGIQCMTWSANGARIAVGAETEGIEIWQAP